LLQQRAGGAPGALLALLWAFGPLVYSNIQTVGNYPKIWYIMREVDLTIEMNYCLLIVTVVRSFKI